MPVRELTGPTEELPKIFGKDGQFDCYVYSETDGIWYQLSGFLFFSVKNYKNQVPALSVFTTDITSTERVYVKEGSEVLLTYKDSGILGKFEIDRVIYEDVYGATIKGYGAAESLLGRKIVHTLSSATSDSTTYRQQYEDTATDTIVGEILSVDGSDSGSYDVEKGTVNNWGDFTVRFENISKLKALTKLTDAVDWYWWCSYGAAEDHTSPFGTAYFNFKSARGADNGVHYYLTGDNNTNKIDYEKDKENMVNYIVGLGAGDGVNQVERTAYAASPTYSTLASNISATATTITLIDASDFASSGTMDIMGEQVTYTGKSGNDLTGCTRGANSTTAVKHPKGCFVSKYVSLGSPPDESNAEANSSISDNGLVMKRMINREFILDDDRKSCEGLEAAMSKLLIDKLDPIVRITVSVNEPRTEIDQIDIGDTVYVTDAEVGLSGDSFEVIGYTIGQDRNRGEFMDIELANKRLTFEELNYETRDLTEVHSSFMQGSTFMYVVTANENAENSSDGRISVYFYIPDDAIAINSITLSYRNDAPRTWHASHNHTVSIGNHSHGLGEITSSSDQAELKSATANYWDEGTTYNTDINPNYTLGVTVMDGPGGDYGAAVVYVYIQNETGSSQDYKWYIKNGATQLESDSATLADGAGIGKSYLISSSDLSNGDTCTLEVYEGTLGTTAGSGSDEGKQTHGMLLLEVHSVGIHNHITAGDTTDNGGSSTPTSSDSGGYDITAHSYSTNDGDVYYTDDASGSPSWTDASLAGLSWTENGSVTDKDMTSLFSGTGWKGIQLRPNGNSRHWVAVKVRGFVKSK